MKCYAMLCCLMLCICMYTSMYGWMHGCMDMYMYVSMYTITCIMYVCRPMYVPLLLSIFQDFKSNSKSHLAPCNTKMDVAPYNSRATKIYEN